MTNLDSIAQDALTDSRFAMVDGIAANEIEATIERYQGWLDSGASIETPPHLHGYLADAGASLASPEAAEATRLYYRLVIDELRERLDD